MAGTYVGPLLDAVEAISKELGQIEDMQTMQSAQLRALSGVPVEHFDKGECSGACISECMKGGHHV